MDRNQTPDGKRPAAGAFLEWYELLVFSLAFVVILMTFFMRNSPVNGSSMFPTLEENDRLVIVSAFYKPKVGDVVIVQPWQQLDEPLVKRVIAVGGQHLYIDFTEWRVVVDGEELDESWVNPEYREKGEEMFNYSLETKLVDGHRVYEADIKEGFVFVMGDNRNNSKDSRMLGQIDERAVIGKAVFRYFPLDKFGSLYKKEDEK